jgi:hypothetical protein
MSVVGDLRAWDAISHTTPLIRPGAGVCTQDAHFTPPDVSSSDCKELTAKQLRSDNCISKKQALVVISSVQCSRLYCRQRPRGSMPFLVTVANLHLSSDSTLWNVTHLFKGTSWNNCTTRSHASRSHHHIHMASGGGTHTMHCLLVHCAPLPRMLIFHYHLSGNPVCYCCDILLYRQISVCNKGYSATVSVCPPSSPVAGLAPNLAPSYTRWLQGQVC